MGIADKVIKDFQVIEDTEGTVTYSFPLRERDQYVERMKEIGYVEIPEFVEADLTKGYWCATCSYFNRKKYSETGYWCSKFEFADRPEGCCGGWQYSKSD